MRRRTLLIPAALLGVVAGLAACETRLPPDEDLQRAVEGQPAGFAEVFARAGITAERACVFGPYTTDEVLSADLGFEWAGASEHTGIVSSDGHELIVAADEDRVLAWAMVLRPSGSLMRDGAYGCAPVS